MRRSQSSSTAPSSALWVGKAPITPRRQAAITNSGPDTAVIGAAMAGTVSRCDHGAVRDKSSTLGQESGTGRSS